MSTSASASADTDVTWKVDPADKLLMSKTKISVDTKDALSDIERLWHGESDGNPDAESSRYVFRKTAPIQEFYNLGKGLGNPGTYGCVQHATLIKDPSKEFAVKIINKWKFKDKYLTKSFFTDLRTECRLMQKAQDHPSIIEIYEVFESINNLYIVMTACHGGELFERIQADDGFSEVKASKIFGQMLSALYYIHQLGIMHCDLKPENFIFKDKKSLRIKMIDFGMAKIVKWREYYKRMNGTPYYIAPEVLNGKYNRACDMWSMGVILFILVYGFPPFFTAEGNGKSKSETYNAIYKKIRQGFEPKVKPGYGAWFTKDIPVSNEYKDLVARLLRSNVASRMTAEEALAHPWITGNCIGIRSTPLPMIRSLRHYRRTCGLQSEILKVLSDCKFLNHDQEEEVRASFKLMDTNGDGVVSAEELFASLRKVDPDTTLEDCQRIITACDANSDAVLELDEFIGARICRKISQKEERLKKLFHCLDLDESGTLNAHEVVAALESIRGSQFPLKEAKKLINQVDINKDGVIDYEEFISLFCPRMTEDMGFPMEDGL